MRKARKDEPGGGPDANERAHSEVEASPAQHRGLPILVRMKDPPQGQSAQSGSVAVGSSIGSSMDLTVAGEEAGLKHGAKDSEKKLVSVDLFILDENVLVKYAEKEVDLRVHPQEHLHGIDMGVQVGRWIDRAYQRFQARR